MFGGKNGKNVRDNIKDVVEDIAEDAAEDVKGFADEAGRAVRKGADDLKTDFVKQLSDSAKRVRKEARAKGVSGDAFKQVEGMAKGMEKAARYLGSNSYEDIGEDIEHRAKKAVKRSPLQILLITFAVGIFVGLLLRGSSERR
jgi:ElaB/YqjD/DUF883 family membrane-anchored ribosome-binding protein